MSNDMRPLELKDFVGQRNVVQQVNVALKAARRENRRFPHFVMSGPPGLGKTTLAKIVSNEMNGKLVSRIASAIKKPEDLVQLFMEVDQLNTIIFIDELEQLDRHMTELLHTALEDGTLTCKIAGRVISTELPEFTFAGATNYVGELPAPFMNRFQLFFDFEVYNTKELYTVLKKAALRSRYHTTKEALVDIAGCSRGTPRTALCYLNRARDFALANDEFWHQKRGEKIPVITWKCVIETFKMLDVDSEGLIKTDREILSYLSKQTRPVGLNAIAQFVNEDVSTVANNEAFLVRKGLMTRTRSGRMITNKGRSYMGPQDDELSDEAKDLLSLLEC